MKHPVSRFGTPIGTHAQDVPAFKGGREVGSAADDSDEEAPPMQLMPQALIDDSGVCTSSPDWQPGSATSPQAAPRRGKMSPC